MDGIEHDSHEQSSYEKRPGAHVRLFFSQNAQAAPAAIAGIIVNLYNLHETVPVYWLTAWAAALVLVFAYRSRLKYRYSAAQQDGTAADIPWGRHITLGAGLSGMLWGLAAFFFLYAVPAEALTFMVVVVTLLVAGNTVTHAAIPYAALAFSTLALSPYVILLLSRGRALDIQIAIALLFIYFIMLRQRKLLMANVSRIISLSDDYISTIKQLEDSQRQSADLIADLEKENRDRRQAETGLLGIEHRFQRAEALAGFGDWQWDINANKCLFSREASRLFYQEYEDKQLIGDIYSHFSKLVHPSDYNPLYNAIEQALKQGTNVDHQFRLISGGCERWLRICAEVIDGDKDKLLYGVVCDVSTDMQTHQRQ